MTKAILIDSAKREVREVDVKNTDDIHELLNGYLELACVLEEGHILYVDGDGLLKPQKHFFRFALRNDQPLPGNGVVVGREWEDFEKGTWGFEDAELTPAQIEAWVTWLSREQVEAWGKANASEPAVFLTSITPEGKVKGPDVIVRFGELIGDMPKPEEEDKDGGS